MKLLLVVGALVIGAWCSLVAQAAPREAQISEVITKDLPELPGREGVVITVIYPPGAADEVHRHDAHGFLYVLEGSVEMQVKGGPPVTLNPGQGFYEGPNDVHIVGRNASNTLPAKFVVFLVKKKGAPILTPVN